MKLITLAILLACGGQQDPAALKTLIQQLDATAIEDRESAFEQLVKIGAPALDGLKAALASTTSEEFRQQASRTIAAIDDRCAIERVCPPGPLITIDQEGTLRELAEAIAAQAKVKAEFNDAVTTFKRPLKLDKVPLLEALDRLCAGREDCTWEQPEAGMIRFLRDRQCPFPTAYPGPFRVRLLSLISEHETDFKKTVQHVSFQLLPDFEKSLQPLTKWTMELSDVVDAGDGRWAISPERHVGAAGAAPVQVKMAMNMMMARQNDPTSWYHADDIDLSVRAIKLIRGTVSYKFPYNAQAVVLDDLGATAAKTVSGFDVGVREQQKNCWVLTFSKKEGSSENLPGEVQDRLDVGSILLVDGDGKESKPDSIYPQNSPMRFVVRPGQPGRAAPAAEVSYRLMIPSFEGKTLKALKFRFVDRTFEKKVPFEFRDIPLP